MRDSAPCLPLPKFLRILPISRETHQPQLAAESVPSPGPLPLPRGYQPLHRFPLRPNDTVGARSVASADPPEKNINPDLQHFWTHSWPPRTDHTTLPGPKGQFTRGLVGGIFDHIHETTPGAPCTATYPPVTDYSYCRCGVFFRVFASFLAYRKLVY